MVEKLGSGSPSTSGLVLSAQIPVSCFYRMLGKDGLAFPTFDWEKMSSLVMSELEISILFFRSCIICGWFCIS